VLAYVAFENLGHQPVDSALDRRNLLKNRSTLRFTFERHFQSGGLTLYATDARQELFFSVNRMRHRGVYWVVYWGIVPALNIAGLYFMSSSSAAASQWTHSHVFDESNPLAESKTARAGLLTALMMVVEIVGGYSFNSMALLADGWHMSSHALALGLSVLAYSFARRLAHDRRFAFGTWKIEVLGGYTSAILLVLVAGSMMFQSIERLMSPSPIHYSQAIAIAMVGLAVNLICAWLLRGEHHHDHGHGHGHEKASHHHGHDHDLNLRSAYVHVVADAATSVLAILALVGGMFFGASWLDPVMGIVGAVLVLVWAYGLLRDSGRVLLDAEMNAPVVDEIREVIAASPVPAEITDLHVWRVGKGKFACILGLVTDQSVSPDEFRRQLSVHDELVHITVELNR
jgi:cation diffusion facilitator family transporter